jgi:diguanylate cyclase (GGDEF)-like protein/PAS domain S-box-containing protein
MTLFEALPIGLAICDMEGQLTYVNQAYASILGYTVAETLELTYWQITPQDYEVQEGEQLAALAEHGRYGPYEKEYIHKDGHRFPVRLSGVLINDNGRELIWSSVEDISLSKASSELSAKTQMLEVTFQNMSDGISMVDANLNLLAFNQRFTELQKFQPDKFQPGDSFESFIRYNAERGEYGPGDVEEQVRVRVELAKKFEAHHFERIMADGTVLEIRGQPMPDGGFVTHYSDITERKLTEKALRDNEAKFKEFAEISSDWFWEMDADLRFTYFSPRNKKITGFEPELYIGKTRREIRYGTPDKENWRRHLEDLDAHRKFRNFEYDLKIADGSSLAISTSGNPVFDDEGVFQGYYGTGRDISKRKQADKDLRDSEQRFRALYDQSPTGISLKDYSWVKARIARLKEDGVKDFKEYFENHEDELKDTILDIRLLDANSTLIELCGLSTFNEYKSYKDSSVSWDEVEWCDYYIGELVSLAKGELTYTSEYKNLKADGSPIEIRCTVRIVSNNENDWSEVITTYEDITARKKAEAQLLQQATVDQVTGLPNRALLFDRVARAMEHAKREQRNIGFIFVDLDRFKQVNDTRGHAAGDQLLEKVGQRLSVLIRHEDTVARLGGDEFIILLYDIELPHGPEIVASKIVESFKAPFDIEGRKTFITASLGISIFPEDGDDAEVLLQNSDAAMYQSKRQGRNTFQFFTPGLSDQSDQNSRVAERLRHALDRGDFELYFQPVVDVMKNRVTAVEALIRWDDAILKNVDPGQLISVAENDGFILPIEKWVLDEACRHVAAWRRDIARSLVLSVNISRSILRNPGFMTAVKGALEASNLPPDAVAIEITESVFIEDSTEVIERLNQLSDMGVRLALDDFGTGYSSLAYLKHFKASALKIDQTFIKDITTNPGDLALVDAIIAMCKSLDLVVVAEGVETPEQLELLKKCGCYLIQGYHFSEPLTVDDMTMYLEGDLPPVIKN